MTNTKYPPSPPPRPLHVQILRTALLTFAWALAVLAGIGLLTFLIAFLSGLLAWLLPFAAILFLALLASIGRGRQRRRAAMILTYLEQSVRLNLPLPPMLRAAAAGESRRAARRLEDLAWAMSQGVSLGQALSLYTP